MGLDFPTRSSKPLSSSSAVSSANADGFHVAQRADNMLRRGQEFFREPSVGNKNNSKHGIYAYTLVEKGRAR